MINVPTQGAKFPLIPILMEFGIGWIVSEGIGIIGGAGTLYGIQEILKRIYPTLVEVKKISFNI